MRSLSLLLLLVLCGCEPKVPEEALQLQPETLEKRQLQTRRFDTANKDKVLKAGVGVLQDLGFNLDESEAKLGVIVASKDRSAVEFGQEALSVAYTVLTMGGRIETDRRQKIRASLVIRPQGEQLIARITFQRIVWNSAERVSKNEMIEDTKIYQEFFSKLSKSVFLEAHSI